MWSAFAVFWCEKNFQKIETLNASRAVTLNFIC